MKYDIQHTRQLNALTKQYLSGIQRIFPDEEIRELVDLLKFHEYRYYVLNQPLISDFEYDILYKRLQQLETDFPQLLLPDSPTQRVASDITEEFISVPHLSPMLSLENSYNEEDLVDFERQVRKLAGLQGAENIDYAVEPKFDGGTVVMVYEGDRLIRGATRGNGQEGEEITNNIRSLKSVPLQASFSESGLHKVELRGEALIRKDVFEKVNTRRAEQGLPLFANPRNAATGGLRVKEVKDIQSRGIEVFVYQISAAYDINGNSVLPQLKSHFATLQLLQQLGFKVPMEESLRVSGIKGVIEFCQYWENKRESYAYEIDGMVVKADDFSIQERCGSTSHHPRWAVAFKFKAKQASSQLLHVEFQVGKTGAITPVAKIEPVALAGVTISSISMHNEDFIQSRDLRIGDQVLVERAGDVIPYIVKSFTELRTGQESEISFPRHCPSCDSELVKPEGEAVWRCINTFCPAQSLQRIIHHVSKDGMDIEGFGKSNVERFYELGLLKDIADVYYLNFESIASLEGFGEKSVTNLMSSIERAKKSPVSKLLQSLSIRQLGKRAAQLIAENISNVKELYQWEAEQYTSIKEVGPILAENMMAFFKNPANQDLLARLETAGVNFENNTQKNTPAVTEGYFAGKKVLFTGTLQQMSRGEAQKEVEQRGAVLISAVSPKLDILVCGESAGSKLKKAEALGTVEIMDETRFIALLQEEVIK